MLNNDASDPSPKANGPHYVVSQGIELSIADMRDIGLQTTKAFEQLSSGISDTTEREVISAATDLRRFTIRVIEDNSFTAQHHADVGEFLISALHTYHVSSGLEVTALSIARAISSGRISFNLSTGEPGAGPIGTVSIAVNDPNNSRLTIVFDGPEKGTVKIAGKDTAVTKERIHQAMSALDFNLLETDQSGEYASIVAQSLRKELFRKQG